MDTEENKLSSSEIEQMLKEAEAVHRPRRTVNTNRKKKKKIRLDMILALIVMLAVIGCVIGLIVHLIGKTGKSSNSSTDNNPLIEEKYPEISDVVKNYLEAYLIQDNQKRIDVLAQYVDNMGDISEGDVAQRSYIEGYSDIECYTKEGPYANTYVVYAYYKMKLKNISTSVPNIDRLYVIRDSNTGNVYVHNGVGSDIQEYIDKVTKDDDVQQLLSDVNQELKETLDSDERLKSLFSQMNPTTAAADAETTAAAETTTTAQATTQAATVAPTKAQQNNNTKKKDTKDTKKKTNKKSTKKSNKKK